MGWRSPCSPCSSSLLKAGWGREEKFLVKKYEANVFLSVPCHMIIRYYLVQLRGCFTYFILSVRFCDSAYCIIG